MHTNPLVSRIRGLLGLLLWGAMELTLTKFSQRVASLYLKLFQILVFYSLCFLVGMELDFQELKENASKAFLTIAVAGISLQFLASSRLGLLMFSMH
jgi:Kef-type K+ transport system membrane component KefB